MPIEIIPQEIQAAVSFDRVHLGVFLDFQPVAGDIFDGGKHQAFHLVFAGGKRDHIVAVSGVVLHALRLYVLVVVGQKEVRQMLGKVVSDRQSFRVSVNDKFDHLEHPFIFNPVADLLFQALQVDRGVKLADVQLHNVDGHQIQIIRTNETSDALYAIMDAAARNPAVSIANPRPQQDLPGGLLDRVLDQIVDETGVPVHDALLSGVPGRKTTIDPARPPGAADELGLELLQITFEVFFKGFQFGIFPALMLTSLGVIECPPEIFEAYKFGKDVFRSFHVRFSV